MKTVIYDSSQSTPWLSVMGELTVLLLQTLGESEYEDAAGWEVNVYSP